MRAVVVAATEAQAQRAGEGRFRHAGVRARVPAAVRAGHRQRGAPTAARRWRGHSGEQGCQPRGQVVGDVVGAGGGPAEVLVPGTAVADHGVEGVHRPVGEQAGQARDRAPQQRRNHGVGRVLGDRLDDGPGDLRLVETVRAAANQVGELLAGRWQVAPAQVGGDGVGLGRERLGAEHRPRARCRDRDEPGAGQPAGRQA